MEIKWRNSPRQPHPAGIQFRPTPSSIVLKLLHIKLKELQAVKDEDRNQNLLSPHQQQSERNANRSAAAVGVCVSACECESAKDVFWKSLLATRRETDTMCEHTDGKRMKMEGTREDAAGGWMAQPVKQRATGFGFQFDASRLPRFEDQFLLQT